MCKHGMAGLTPATKRLPSPLAPDILFTWSFGMCGLLASPVPLKRLPSTFSLSCNTVSCWLRLSPCPVSSPSLHHLFSLPPYLYLYYMSLSSSVCCTVSFAFHFLPLRQAGSLYYYPLPPTSHVGNCGHIPPTACHHVCVGRQQHAFGHREVTPVSSKGGGQ